MITLNKKKFAESEAEFTDSLFSTDGTCVGYAKRNKCSVTLYNHNHEKIGAINRHGCLCRATKVEGGYWYDFGTIKEIGDYYSCRETREIISELTA